MKATFNESKIILLFLPLVQVFPLGQSTHLKRRAISSSDGSGDSTTDQSDGTNGDGRQSFNNLT